MTASPESECVRIKRRGADYVAQLTDKMTLEEQLIFWQQRTDALRQRQEAKRKRPSSTH
ncbi:hypothetical protein U5801_17595 [Lamprobacter modestohalophilus]|uniref:hypothetical protein n=1 Tax=Lamprobacter modestohalophilus TaxID=1064514 RepID=UPI002ADEE6EF|nr:hypothetical protein [Lamprobacter modestohalophilus]MEA1051606.1 hypothetical protein [Lamprobacter modestohalophilus]